MNYTVFICCSWCKIYIIRNRGIRRSYLYIYVRWFLFWVVVRAMYCHAVLIKSPLSLGSVVDGSNNKLPILNGTHQTRSSESAWHVPRRSIELEVEIFQLEGGWNEGSWLKARWVSEGLFTQLVILWQFEVSSGDWERKTGKRCITVPRTMEVNSIWPVTSEAGYVKVVCQRSVATGHWNCQLKVVKVPVQCCNHLTLALAKSQSHTLS